MKAQAGQDEGLESSARPRKACNSVPEPEPVVIVSRLPRVSDCQRHLRAPEKPKAPEPPRPPEPPEEKQEKPKEKERIGWLPVRSPASQGHSRLSLPVASFRMVLHALCAPSRLPEKLGRRLTMPSDAFATPRSVVEKGGVYCGRKRSSGELAGCFEAFTPCNTTMRICEDATWFAF